MYVVIFDTFEMHSGEEANELYDGERNRRGGHHPTAAASLKQQQSTSNDIYCAFY